MNTTEMILELGNNLEKGIIDKVTTMQVLLDNPSLLENVVETLYINKRKKALWLLCQARRVLFLEKCYNLGE